MLAYKELFKYLKAHEDVPCYKDGEPGYPHNFTELAVQITAACNGHCKFCCNSKSDDYNFSFEKFKEMFLELQPVLPIDQVSFTGGEPTLFAKIVDVMQWIRTQDPKIGFHINTNGSNLSLLKEIADVGNVDIRLSRHHYDDKTNAEIFGSTHIPTLDQLQNLGLRLLIHCNLMQGYIDSPQECTNFIYHMATHGIRDIGFITLMPYTDWAREHFVQFRANALLGQRFPNGKVIGALKYDRRAIRHDVCCCEHVHFGVPNIMPQVYVMFKHRINIGDACPVKLNFVYNHNKLLHGFNGEVVWQSDKE